MTLTSGRALEIAAEIAESLCRTSYSHGNATTWMGTERTADEESLVIQTAYAAVGPTLYSGNAGIALFLADAYARLREEPLARRALGALEHACTRLDRVEPKSRFAFYGGAVGVAYALARAGRSLERPDLLSQARQIVHARLMDADGDSHFLDLIVGASGGAVALLVLRDLLADDRCAEIAHALGHGVVRGATRSDAGWSWGERANGDETTPHLTGFGHGAAGIGWALAELHAEFGDPEFLLGAREAFRYEAHWFQAARDNWPDFRLHEEGDPLACSTAWCHGAPGIGLSRLRPTMRDDEPAWRRDLEAAVRTTRRTLEDRDEQQEMSYTLCHGQGSLAEFLCAAGGWVGDAAATRLATETLARGADRHAGRPETWTTGLGRGSNPSLMLGLAGIGHLYLRAADPTVPSVLCCGREPRIAQGRGLPSR